MSAEATSGSSNSGSGGGYEKIIIAAMQIGVGMVLADSERRAQAEMMERLMAMSLESKRQIAERLAQAQSDTERMRIVYQALAVNKNRDALDRLSQRKTVSIIALSLGLATLGIVILIARKRNG